MREDGFSGARLALDEKRPLQRDRGVDSDLQILRRHISFGALEALHVPVTYCRSGNDITRDRARYQRSKRRAAVRQAGASSGNGMAGAGAPARQACSRGRSATVAAGAAVAAGGGEVTCAVGGATVATGSSSSFMPALNALRPLAKSPITRGSFPAPNSTSTMASTTSQCIILIEPIARPRLLASER